jgi:hypothetical protein
MRSRRPPARARIEQFIAFFDLGFATLTDKLLGAYLEEECAQGGDHRCAAAQPEGRLFDEPLDGLDANAAGRFQGR